MNIDTRVNLNLNLSQRLVMTPMLQQAIKLLQMSRLELVDLVQQEMLENPILDEAEEGIEPRQDTSEEQYQDQQKSIDEDAPDLEQLNNRQEESVNWEDYFDDNPASLGYSGEYESEEDTQTYENILTNSQTLSEYLTWQLQMSQLPEHGLKIGRFLIGQINEDGYIHGEDLNISPSFNIHATHLKPKQLKIYRACVSKALCQKINAEFEREYLSKHLDIPPGGEQGMLANILLQEYYEELTTSDFQQLLRKLQQFILEDFEVLTTCMSELPSQGVEKITGIPKAEIEQGLRIMTALCRELRSIIESHTRVFLQESYEGKLEKLRITPEELYFLEYLLSKLSVEEITYIVSKENASQTPKREQELQVFLEKLQQSYAHIESLQSHKYFLIQLYHVGIHLLLEKFHAGSPTRFQKQFFKLLDITEDDLAQIARKITSRVEEFYKTESRITCEEVDQILRQIQTFAPSGVGARDLKECLTIQANNLEISDTPAMSIITHYLYELELKLYKKIA